MFEPSLNIASNYKPYYNYPDLSTIEYNHIDLFYEIVSGITSLGVLPINRTGLTFRKYNSYLKPAYDNLMNNTKLQLHSKFTDIFRQMTLKQLGFIVGQVIIFIVFIIIIFFNIRIFLERIKNVMSILGDFSINDINKILSYWNLVNRSFNIMFK